MDPLALQFGHQSVDPEKRKALIRRTFAAVAPRYDLMNDLMSFGIHRLWKRRFVRSCTASPGAVIVDLAGGTGDIAFLLRAHGARPIVVDPGIEMMKAGRERARAQGVLWVGGEAEHLPFADASVDCIAIAFGIRNVTQLSAALAEIHRVLKPGGHFACLEFSRPFALIRPFYELWSRIAIPRLGATIAGTRDAYLYLIESISRFPDQKSFAGMIEGAGFTGARWRNLSFGIAAIHTARKLG